MKLSQVVTELDLEVRAGAQSLDRDIAGGYSSDLLSDVIGRAREGDVWVTLQTHQNIVAVATLKDIAAIIIVNSREPDPETIAKADDEGVPILVSKEPTFLVVGRLYSLGVLPKPDEGL